MTDDTTGKVLTEGQVLDRIFLLRCRAFDGVPAAETYLAHDHAENDLLADRLALRALLREALGRLHYAIGAVDTKYEENLDWIAEIRRAVFGESSDNRQTG